MPRLSKIGAAALAAFGWTSGAAGPALVTASYLQVAGGGGGGSTTGGGGGAGGLLTGTTSLNPTLSYTVVVGSGGAGGASTNTGSNGSNSSITGLTQSLGGGGGGGEGAPKPPTTGGSGGGGGWNTAGAAGTSGQGNAGGTGGNGPTYYNGAGGGGAGAVGASSSGTVAAAGAGGVGVSSSITGTATFYAGGGGGGGDNFRSGTGGAGGNGGGGAGSTTGVGSNATANTGGGGGGSCDSPSGQAGGSGGSGVVIISYAGAQQFGGGVVTSVGGNTIHTFLTSGTLSPINSLSASYLIVAGGGGGASNGGGGGAGGLLTSSGLTIDTASTYVVTVGSGGTGGVTNGVGTAGANSAFSLVSTAAVGGGRGGSGGGGAGSTGGSGGGGNAGVSGYAGTAGQGNTGGDGGTVTPPYYSAGGGGGAGAVGGAGNSVSGASGAGGIGLTSSISGTSTYYAGGGGGGGYAPTSGGAGGLGGGGAGFGNANGGAGTANTGGGGGGAGYNNGAGPGQTGGAGGSGIVIISYAGSTQLMAGGTVTISGGNVIHTFLSSGYLTPLTLVGNSLRFRASASAFLTRANPTAGSTTTFTWSGWVKRGQLGASNATQYLFSGGASQNTSLGFGLVGDADALGGNMRGAGGTNYFYGTSAVFRDPAAWYHIVLAVDTTQATASNRVKLYVNGTLQTLGTANYPTQNLALLDTGTRYIGSEVNRYYLDGYMTNINFIDGQALTPNSFGTFNSYGVWQPITYGGSYGTNGFYLPFTSNTTSAFTGVFSGTNYITSNYNFNWASGGNFTMEAWVNASSFSSTVNMIGGTTTAQNDGFSLLYYYTSGAIAFGINGTNEFISATGLIKAGNWYHVALVNNGGTLTIYLNGRAVAVTTSGSTYLSNNSAAMRMGGNTTSTQGVIGNMSNFRFVTSAVYTANFTPPTTNLTAIANTQLLTFQNSTIIDNSGNSRTLTNTGSVTTSTQYPNNLTVFDDKGSAGNNWTPNNISLALGSTYDSMTDVPTLTSATAANYATLNPLTIYGNSNVTMTGANLNLALGTTAQWRAYSGSTITMQSGSKWYFEVNVISSSGGDIQIGVATSTLVLPTGNVYPSSSASAWVYQSDGTKSNNNTGSSYGATYTSNDVIGVALDMTTGALTFYKNNASQGTAYTLSTTNDYVLCLGGAGTAPAVSVNFGQRPFRYTPPSGFVALNTFNL